jgi:hypothetical protein
MKLIDIFCLKTRFSFSSKKDPSKLEEDHYGGGLAGGLLQILYLVTLPFGFLEKGSTTSSLLASQRFHHGFSFPFLF